MKVLLAEDDPTTRSMVNSMLSMWGYEVTLAKDGDEAWQILQGESAPKLLILDWFMPGIDGMEICKRMRKGDSPDMAYIILLTAKDNKEDIVSGLTAGADDYITKPFNSEELRARIRAGVRVIELQTALAAKVQELQEALSHIKTLQGILPICVHCHKIRTDQKAWQQLEAYLQDHTEVQVSHSLCPDCFKEHYPDLYEEDA